MTFISIFTNTHSHIIIECKHKFEGDGKMDCSEEPRGIFLVIDNKSFYATIECTTRGLDPLTTPLVVMSEAENTNGGLVRRSCRWTKLGIKKPKAKGSVSESSATLPIAGAPGTGSPWSTMSRSMAIICFSTFSRATPTADPSPLLD